MLSDKRMPSLKDKINAQAAVVESKPKKVAKKAKSVKKARK